MRVGNLTWPSLNANQARIYGKISRITLWAFDLRLGRGVSPHFQPQQVSLRLQVNMQHTHTLSLPFEIIRNSDFCMLTVIDIHMFNSRLVTHILSLAVCTAVRFLWEPISDISPLSLSLLSLSQYVQQWGSSGNQSVTSVHSLSLPLFNLMKKHVYLYCRPT